jgi:hypothetical protein
MRMSAQKRLGTKSQTTFRNTRSGRPSDLQSQSNSIQVVFNSV